MVYVNYKNLKIAPYKPWLPPMHLQIGTKVFSVIAKLLLIDNDSTIIIFLDQITESQESSSNKGYDSGFSSFSSMFMDIEQDSIIAKNTLLETQTFEATGKI